MAEQRKLWIKRVVNVGVPLLLVALVFYLGNQKGFTWQQYAQLVVDGVRGGAIYALIALGFVTVYNVTGIINFAQGAFVMLGAMLAATVYELPLPFGDGWRLVVAFVTAVLLTTLVGVLIERLTIYPARHSTPLTLIIITVGVYIAIQGIALLVWGTNALSFPAFTTLGTVDKTIRVGGVVLKAQSFWIWGTTAVILVLLAWFFDRTMLGKGLRACAINRQAARLMGISTHRMSMLSFALAAALGAIGGIVLAPVTRPIYDMGLRLGLKGFVAAIMGGLVSSPAAVLGGLLLGVVENVAAGVTKSGIKDIFAFIILILILLFRPQGILSKAQETEKV
ncbi:MAG: branched-chain amino acid ABC transporter permease [Chloroflexi bacterium]|nr:MAG: branched-chain amino acid ABC transporter permease [Chloroflexota bacterium]